MKGEELKWATQSAVGLCCWLHSHFWFLFPRLDSIFQFHMTLRQWWLQLRGVGDQPQGGGGLRMAR